MTLYTSNLRIKNLTREHFDRLGENTIFAVLSSGDYYFLQFAKTESLVYHPNCCAEFKYTVEYRDGSMNDTYWSGTNSLALIIEAFRLYWLGLPGWRNLFEWSRLSLPLGVN